MKSISTLVLISVAQWMYSQNLVINPSFENHSACPNQINQVDFATGWKSWGVTPDYFNACANTTAPNFGVPLNNRAFQPARTGVAYMGLFTYTVFLPNQREFIGGQLSSPLIPGQQYFISFWVNHVENSVLLKASDGIGLKFSTVDHNYFAEPDTANDAPHVFANTIITDTVNWVQVHGTFLADSAYTFFGLGNYFGDSLTTVIQMGTGNSNYAYYFIDDVCISTDHSVCEVPLSFNSVKQNDLFFQITPQPADHDVIVYFRKTVESGRLEIKNLAGQLLLKEEINGQMKLQLNTFMLPAGVYITECYSDRKIYRSKLIISR
ncbi:MAG: T9SS type A sorting domain-containing protein [Bacteroidia bacterium]|nr:T9SS type A sorting domain-containing protein [Bacteroidia bacterium]